MDKSRYISASGVYVLYILDDLILNSWTELLAVIIRGLVRFMHVNKSMEHLFLNNKYLTF